MRFAGLMARLLPATLLVAACSGGGSSATPEQSPTEPSTTASAPAPPTSTTGSGSASSTTLAPPTTLAVSGPLPRPVIDLPLTSPAAGARAGQLWSLVADDQGLWFVRADGSVAQVLAGATRAALTVDARRVVFQRAGEATQIELLDVLTGKTQVVVPGDASQPVSLEDVGDVGDRPTVLFSRRSAVGVTILRVAAEGGVEQALTTLAPGTVLRELTMSPTHIVGIVATGDVQRTVHLTIDGAAGPAFPEDCATRPCAAWTCTPTTDPCRRHVAAAPAGTANYAIAFVEERSGGQVATRAELAIDGTAGRYDGWVPLPDGTVVRSVRVASARYLLVNTWASADRSGPGRAVVVDVFAKSTFTVGRAGLAATGDIVDPAPFAATPVDAEEIVTDRDGLWLLRRDAPPRRVLDHPVVFARAGTTAVVAQRAYDPAAPERPLPLVLVDTTTGAVRDLFSLDAASGERGLLVTVGQIDGRPEAFYQRAAPAGDRSQPAGTVLLYRRALDASAEQLVGSLGENIGYGSNVLQGIHVVGRTVFATKPTVGANRPVAFDLDGNEVDHFAGMSYCPSGRTCTPDPPSCGDSVCVTHFAVSPDGARIAWVLASLSNVIRFEFVVVDAVRGTVVARSLLPNNPTITLVGGLAWRADDRLIVQTFAPSPGAVSGAVLEATVRGAEISYAAWPFPGLAYTQRALNA